MICLAAFRQSRLRLSSYLMDRTLVLCGGESRLFSTSGPAGKQTFSKPKKEKTVLLYAKKKTPDYYIFWYKGFFIGYPLLLLCLGPYYVELVNAMYPDPGLLRYFSFAVPAVIALAVYKVIHMRGLGYPLKAEYTSDRTLKMQVISWPGKLKTVTANPAEFAIKPSSKPEVRLIRPSKVISNSYVFDKKKGTIHNQKIINKVFSVFDPADLKRHRLQNRLRD